MYISRRAFGAMVGAAATSIVSSRPAGAAQFNYKFSHPFPVGTAFDVRTKELWANVERDTSGRLKVDVYANNVLGTDTAVLGQARAGALEFLAASEAVLSTVAPLAGILNMGFAFKNPAEAHAVIDGPLGDMIRKQITSAGLVVLPKAFDSGMRQMTCSRQAIKEPDDLAGLKLRVPPAKLFVDLFQTLGASPVAINFAEIYTSLQTHLIEATELPVQSIDSLHVYEVQKYLSVTNHAWSGLFLLAAPEAWKALPADVQAIVQRDAERAMALETKDVTEANVALVAKLKTHGMVVNTADTDSFRKKLSPFYERWRTAFGPTAFELLERTSGHLG